MIRSPWHNAPKDEDVPPAAPKEERPDGIEVRVFHENPFKAVEAFQDAMHTANEIADRIEAGCERYEKSVRHWKRYTRVNVCIFGFYVSIFLLQFFFAR